AAHRRLRPGVAETHALDRRHQLHDAGAELDLERTRRAEARAVACRAGERLDKPARRVPVNQRAPRHHVVDKGVAVDVRETGAGGAADEEWRAAHRLEGANGTIDAAGVE